MSRAFDLFRRVARDGEAAAFLDRFVCVRPSASFCYQRGEAWIREAGAWRRTGGEPFGALRAFARGSFCVGLVSYDAGRLIERISSSAEDDVGVPDLLFHRFDAWWEASAEGEPRLSSPDAELAARARSPPRPVSSASARPAIVPRTSEKAFEGMVLRAQEHIRAGDVFQVNLSQRLETTTRLDPVALYHRLREANPAPFAGYFASGPLPDGAPGFFVLSSSPERLFSLHGVMLEARPIAGTRPRGATPAEDERLKAELLANAKERSEHVMLVDLARNDLGRVARFGSVRVPELLTVESYRAVHHLVSVVGAELAEGMDAVDALVALFPGGTITGAPKVRAMEIIEDLEPVRRGIYTGSLGWMSPDGDADFNILIRTLLVREGVVHLQVGAGIVEESVPAREYQETLAKAKALLRALGAEP